jgi:hypothetical protein
MMDIDETNKYKLDIKRTLIGNIPYILYMIIIGIYIIIVVQFLGTFQSPDMALLGFIVWAFSTFFILYFLLNHLLFVLKELVYNVCYKSF